MLEVSVFIHWCKSQDFSRPPAESLHPSYGAHLLRLLPALGAEVSCLEERRIQNPTSTIGNIWYLRKKKYDNQTTVSLRH